MHGNTRDPLVISDVSELPITPATCSNLQNTTGEEVLHATQVSDAIVRLNGWDDATVALQLLSHLEGDALNVGLYNWCLKRHESHRSAWLERSLTIMARPDA